MRAKFHKDVSIITLAAALALSGANVIAPVNSARAAENTQAPTVTAHAVAAPSPSIGTVASTPAGAILDDDGDGDELMEHWSDPRDIREQHVQLAGMFFMFLITAGVVVRQKLNLRRLARG